MQTIHQLLDEYGASHKNRTNKVLHWICVPAIFWTVIAFLWSLPFPGERTVMGVPVNWAVIALLVLQIYYFKLSVTLALGFLVINIALLMFTDYAGQHCVWPLWQVALLVFVIAWIGQFVGHAIEGKRPSFFQDLQFLLIGPAWLLATMYRTAGIRY